MLRSGWASACRQPRHRPMLSRDDFHSLLRYVTTSPQRYRQTDRRHVRSISTTCVWQCDARPTVTFPPAEHHCRAAGTNLHCFGDRQLCVNNLPKVVICQWNDRESNPPPQSPRSNTAGPHCVSRN